MAKVITVFGATGSQGSSVIRSILDHPSLSHNYRIRGVSRHVASDTARSLIEKGIDMVQADLNDASSVYEAVKGSHVVFAMTNFWESKSAAIELAQGKVVADACKALNVELLIWSTLCHATEVSNGKLSKVHHFDTKAEVEKYIRSLNIPATFVNPGCFMANLRIMLSKTHDGNYTLELPMPPSTEIPMIDAARDTGKWVTSAMLKRSEALGQHFLEADGWYTINDICDIFLKVTGKQIRFQEVSETDFAAAVGEEVCEAWLLLRDFAYFGPAAKERLADSLKFLDQNPTSLRQYLLTSGPW